MGHQAKLNRNRKKLAKAEFEKQQQEEMDFAKRRQEFSIECSWNEMLFKRKFAGRLEFSDEEIKPVLKLVKIPRAQLKKGKANLESMKKQDYEELGLKVTIPAPLSVSEKITNLIPKLRKRNLMRRYHAITLRKKMLYFTFVGEQNGSLVGAVDIRKMENEEYESLKKKK